MTPRTRIALLIFAAVFAAAPSLAIAAMACTSCCCPPPCHGTAGGCETTLAAAPCRDEAPATVPSVAKRSVQAPTFHATIPARPAPVARVCRARLPARGGDLDLLVSPLRLSVVLRI